VNVGWIVRMAWRDSRHSRRRLLLYTSAILMGVAALVAVRSLGENLLATVDEQAKVLLGADLAVRSRAPFAEEAERLFVEIGGEQARETSFSSMAFFPEQQSTRLAQIRAVSGGFPFYGELSTEPAEAAERYLGGPFALVDDTLLLQFDVRVGDELRLGHFTFEIVGRLLQIPGESAAASDFAPRIYIPSRHLPDTGLIQPGSRVRYTTYFKLPRQVDPEALAKSLESRVRSLELRLDTVEERKEGFQRELGNLSRFLGLVAFIALVLGGIGVASSIHLYIRQRIATVAVLRCVGATPAQSFAIYVVQAAAMGAIGAAAGVIVGLGAQALMPRVFRGLLPFEVESAISYTAVAEGVAIGLATAMLFALIPLAPVRRISPLLTLRSDLEKGPSLWRDPLVWTLVLAATGGLLAFSLWYSTTWKVGVGFFGGLLTAFGLLLGVAKAIMILTRRFFPSSWRYEWRQGLANLYRPHNQTAVLMLAVGLGTFFIVTLYQIQNSVLREVDRVGAENRPNLVLFDIQSDQREPIVDLVRESGLEIFQEVPVVTMRLRGLNGVSVEEIRNRPERKISEWALVREYQSTYRDHLTDSERLVEGGFQPRASTKIEISVEEGIARSLGVGLGDSLLFDVQGVPLEVEVGSIREVEWRNFRPNFFLVFPAGVLEEAPQFHVVVTRTESAAQSAALQRTLVSRFPNVSAIDLALVVQTIDSILDRLSFVIRFMALFSIVTAILVMMAAIVTGRFQRMKESTLLRTLGASRSQIHRILLIEYLFMGLFSATTGLILSLPASWALAYFVFESAFVPDWWAVLGVVIAVVGLTIALGLSNSRGILSQPPLEVLRGEG
jgi:putative ABC transport system permease protein